MQTCAHLPLEHCSQLIKGVIGSKGKGESRVGRSPRPPTMGICPSDPTVWTWATRFLHVSDFTLHAFHVLDMPVLYQSFGPGARPPLQCPTSDLNLEGTCLRPEGYTHPLPLLNESMTPDSWKAGPGQGKWLLTIACEEACRGCSCANSLSENCLST